MPRPLLALSALAVLACGGGRGIDATRAAALFDRVTVDTAGVHGLSGLAADDAGGLWTVAERGKMLLRVELDGTTVRAVTRHAVDIADRRELEALAWAGGELYAGVESDDGIAHVVALHRDGERFRAAPFAELTAAELGAPIGDNHGVEGLCAAGDSLIAAIEAAATDERGRWAPLIVIDRAVPTRRTVRRLRLTSPTGKLSALDCRPGAGGAIDVLAIERHFEITRFLRFRIDATTADITPTIALDLAPALRGALNLEGIVWRGDHPIAVVDNQYGRITGPDELLVFKRPSP